MAFERLVKWIAENVPGVSMIGCQIIEFTVLEHQPAHMTPEKIDQGAMRIGGFIRVPYDEAYEDGFEDMERRVPDTTKINAAIGWAPQHNLAEILRDVVAHEQATVASAA